MITVFLILLGVYFMLVGKSEFLSSAPKSLTDSSSKTKIFHHTDASNCVDLRGILMLRNPRICSESPQTG